MPQRLLAGLFALFLASVAAAQVGQPRALYQTDARDPHHRAMIDFAREDRMLEGLLEQVNREFRLNEPLSFALGECGEANAKYLPARNLVLLCVEFIPFVLDGVARTFPRASQQQQKELATSGLTFVLMHEVAHALIDIQRLPVLGRDEDAADNIASYLALATGSAQA